MRSITYINYGGICALACVAMRCHANGAARVWTYVHIYYSCHDVFYGVGSNMGRKLILVLLPNNIPPTYLKETGVVEWREVEFEL